MTIKHLTVLLTLPILLAACETTPEPLPAPVVINQAPIIICEPVSALKQVIIPAETKIQFAITQIDNPPYEPIERKVKQVKVVKQAQITYEDSQGNQVLDICEDVPIGPTGPGIGEIIPDP